ncbi:MAG: hypothetical protein CVU57_20945 [Deltaproteobacteria bacterium HGW-Deltaproteobacteria-15]|jgi:hypothetical protein|nr:MAG: hypothetical protein CVU57_20945 [Deltaproteobacteria bacterium HGW-Deltaproteobacteria-15]PKN99386.1 MAG: hypothetical protein CVU43_15310 [Chloroflexi bacterium HGW-Chloroflexi-5]
MKNRKRDSIFEDVEKIVKEFVLNAQEELESRWKNWELDVALREFHEVVGGLLARQTTLAIQIARNPLLWNGHGAPVLLRAMADVYINLAWIFGDAAERPRKFILYGLGQIKLYLEHRKALRENRPLDPQEEAYVRGVEDWIQSQRVLEMTDVNLGSWAEITTRKMAEEAGCLDFYNYVYIPFSWASHSMWPHVEQSNLKPCQNPLHRPHRIPHVEEAGINPLYLHLAAKYLGKAFSLFDEKTGVRAEVPSALHILERRFEAFAEKKRKKNAPRR